MKKNNENIKSDFEDYIEFKRRYEEEEEEESISEVLIALFNTLIILFLLFQTYKYFSGKGSELDYITDNIESIKNTEFEQELKFREKIISDFKQNYSQQKDSISLPDKNTYNFFISPDKISKYKTSKEINIEDIENIPTSKVYDFLSLKYEYKINPLKFSLLIQTENTYDKFIENLKYRDYIETKISISKKIRTNLFIIAGSIWIFINILLFVIPKMFIKTKDGYIINNETKKTTRKILNKEREEVLRNLENSNSKTYKDRITEKLNLLEFKYQKLLKNNSIEHFLDLNIENTNKQARETKNRATVMLLSGLLMSFTAIAVFYVTLPIYTKEDEYIVYIIKGIRPVAILIFIESISWYLLKQYRKMIADYKYFYKILQIKIRHLEIYKLINDPEQRENKELINYIKQENLSILNYNETKSETDNSLEYMKLLKDLIKVGAKKNLP